MKFDERTAECFATKVFSLNNGTLACKCTGEVEQETDLEDISTFHFLSKRWRWRHRYVWWQSTFIIKTFKHQMYILRWGFCILVYMYICTCVIIYVFTFTYRTSSTRTFWFHSASLSEQWTLYIVSKMLWWQCSSPIWLIIGWKRIRISPNSIRVWYSKVYARRYSGQAEQIP